MTAAVTVELPSIAELTSEQKKRLLAMLITDEVDSQPVPLPIVVRLDDRVLGVFRPKWVPPEKATPYPFTPEEREELIRIARNPGETFTARELRVLDLSERDGTR